MKNTMINKIFWIFLISLITLTLALPASAGIPIKLKLTAEPSNIMVGQKSTIIIKLLNENDKLVVTEFDIPINISTNLKNFPPSIIIPKGSHSLSKEFTSEIPGIVAISVNSKGLIGDTTSIAVIPVPSISYGGGGGGGGGGASGDVYINIEIKEKYYKGIYKDISTNYHFSKNYLIKEVNITGNVNAGLVTTMVEVLRNTSTLVDYSAPGNVYKNVNIWVGTAGFAVPKNIKEATIKFEVNKTWLDENGINEVVMYRYTDDEWVKLTTKKIGEENGFIVYYAITDRFSPYAISGFRDNPDKATSQPISEQTAAVTGDEENSELDTVGIISTLTGVALPKGDKGFGSILMLVGLVGIVIFLGLLRRRRK